MKLKSGLQIEESQFSELDEEDWEQFFLLDESWFREINPGDAFPDRTLRRNSLLHPHPLWEFHDWKVTLGERWVGYAGICFLKKENKREEQDRVSQLELYVPIERRGQGIGSALLEVAQEKAKERGRVAFLDTTSLEAGSNFILHRGGRILNERWISRLYFKELDWKKVSRYKEEGARLSTDASLHLIELMPEEWLQEYITLYNTIGSNVPDAGAEGFVPQDQTSLEDRRATEELVRAKGITYLTVLARNGKRKLVGLSETYHNPARPERVEQSITGVLPPYRGRGLGKWLKAEMLQALRQRLPQARFLETGNVRHNEAMLAINRALGFRPHHVELQYPLEFL